MLLQPSQHNKGAALITGGARRVGSFICEAIASSGYNIIIHYKESESDAKKMKEKIELLYPIKCKILYCNLLDDGAIKTFVNEAYNMFPKLHILINNASIFKKCHFPEVKNDLFNDHMDIHVKIPLLIVQEMILKASYLSVINIIDEFVIKKSSTNYFSYLLSKKSMLILSEMMEDTMYANNFVINCIMPGKIFDNKNISKNLYSLSGIIKYLLYTRRCGLKIYL